MAEFKSCEMKIICAFFRAFPRSGEVPNGAPQAIIAKKVCSDVVRYPKTRNPREKPDFFDTRTRPKPRKRYPYQNPARLLDTFVLKNQKPKGKTQKFLIPEPDPNPRNGTRTQPEPNFCYPTTSLTCNMI